MNLSFFGNRVLSISFLIAMAMVSVEVSPVIGAFCFLLMFWKFGVEKYGWRPLSRRWTSALSIFSLVLVVIQFRTIIGQEASFTFLLALAALRVMDYRTQRDHRFVVLLGFLLVAIKALFSLDIYWIIPSGIAFAGLWYSLLPLHLPGRGKELLRIFLLSMPFAVIMFFAFPRYVLPWAMSRGGGGQGEIGFSDDINPGKVADLAATSAMAFRARLQNIPLIVTSELYWRGSVLTLSKGLSWTAGRNNLGPIFENPEKLATYDVAIEATSSRYIFTLDGTRAVRSESGTILNLDQDVFRTTRPINKATVYVGYWDKDYVAMETPSEQDLQVPPLLGKVRAWVDEVQAKKLSVQNRLKEIQTLFSQSGFVYTLSPGIYGANDLEEFLFERKRGFCEHYAGAYASLARGLGIPSRVVIGYHGGRYNPWGDFWKVSQKDAHAWVEIFVDGKWQRQDPTAWVAPLRLTIGAEEFFNLSEEDQQTFAKSANWRPSFGSSIEIWDQITFWAEDLNYQWTYFLIDFDRASQQNFWDNLLQQKVSLVIIITAMGVFIYAISRNAFRRRKKLNKAQRLLVVIESWGRAQRKMRAPEEPPLQYLSRLQKDHPHLAGIIEKIKTTYDQATYAGVPIESTRDILREWKKEIKKGPCDLYPKFRTGK